MLSQLWIEFGYYPRSAKHLTKQLLTFRSDQQAKLPNRHVGAQRILACDRIFIWHRHCSKDGKIASLSTENPHVRADDGRCVFGNSSGP